MTRQPSRIRYHKARAIRTGGTPVPPREKFLAAGFDLCGNEADFVHTRRVGNINHVRDVGERNIVIPFYKHDFFRARFENVGQPALQTVPSRVVLVDLEARSLSRALVNDLDNDGAIVALVLRGIRWRRLRHQRVQPFRREWRNDHKNDQQHQQHVDHRGYVDLTSLAPAGADCHTHKKSPSEPIRFRWRRAPEADCWSASSDRLTAPDRPPLQHEHCPPRQLRICTSPARPPGGKRSYPYGWRFGL